MTGAEQAQRAGGQSPLDSKVARTLLTRRGRQAPKDQLSDRTQAALWAERNRLRGGGA